MNKRSIKQAVARAQWAAAKAGIPVLRRQRKLQEIRVKARKKMIRDLVALGGIA